MNQSDIFKQRQQLPLDAKINMTMNRIRAWFDYWDGDICLGLSGGKDSQVLGEILDMMGGKYAAIPRVFSNTGLEMPEIVKHVREYLAKERGWNVVEVRPKKTYDKVWKEEGIPVVSKKVAKAIRVLNEGDTGKNSNMYKLFNEGVNSKGVSAPNWKIPEKWRFLVGKVKTTEKCCDYLKKEPLRTFKRTSGLKAMTGMMAEEGGYRAGMTQCNMYDTKEPMSSPMLFWTEADIWGFIEKYDVRICSAYYTRVFNDNAELVATDWKWANLPSWEEFLDSNKFLHCVESDDMQTKGFGSYAILSDAANEGGKYFMLRGEQRTGCMFCAFGAHLEKGANRFQRMSISHPRQHAIIMDRIGMREPLKLIGVKTEF